MEKVINKKTLILLSLLLLLLPLFSGCFLTPSVNQALVRNITQNTDYTLIQAALDAANSGDIIEVYDGTYNENIIFPVNMVITLRSVSGASSTIIEGDDGSETVICNGSLDGTTLQGFTITHASGGFGSGVYIAYSPNNYLTISSCTIFGNTAYFYGGGIVNEGTLTITGSTISGNIAPESGGGIVNEGTLTITGSTISGNIAPENGGGIYNRIEDGSCILTVTGGSTISGNAAAFGGGISNQGTLTVTGGSTISGNTGTAYGGGIFNYYNSGSASTIVNGGSTISGNTSNLGGGIYNEEILTVAGSFISDNSALSNAGGIYLCTDANVIIGGIGDFNTFTDNYKIGFAPSADQHIRYANRDCHTDRAYLNNTFVPN